MNIIGGLSDAFQKGMTQISDGSSVAPLFLAIGAAALFGEAYSKLSHSATPPPKPIARKVDNVDFLFTQGELDQKPKIAWSEIQNHTSKDDCWVVLQNKYIVNVTDLFKRNHPATQAIFLNNAGKDMSKMFFAIPHKPPTFNHIHNNLVGLVA